jgi:predicted MFS family arabinose efflux permease
VIGGILTEFLGWRSIFWFLTIYCGLLLVLFIIVFPETCRSVVGNGSIPSQKWNVSLLTYLALKKAREAGIPAQPRLKPPSSSQIGPLGAARMLVDKESGIILMYCGLLFAGFYMVMAALPLQLAAEYGFNELQVGLCFIPLGMGSMLAAITIGKLADKNFARHAARLGIEISKSKQQNLLNFPIERARLEIAVPLLAIAHLGVIAYGWVMQNRTSLAGPLILLFVFGFVVSGSMNVLGTLIVDLNRSSAATATAALNLTRCLLGAAGVAVMQPMLEAMGQGWTSVTLVGIWILCAPGMWLVWKYGPKWREEKRVKEEKKEAERNERERDSEASRDP